MTTLALAVDADDELWTLDNLPTPEAPYVTVGDELIEVRSRFPSQIYSLTGQALPPKIRVRRGIAGTTKASHIQGSTLTPNYGLGGEAGAGGVTVDNQSDPPAEVTTLIAPGAVIAGDEATLPLSHQLLGPFRVNFNSAGITGAGALATSALPAGALLVCAWAEVVTSWTFDEPGTIALQVAPNSDPGNTYLVTQYLTTIDDEISAQGDATIGLEASTNPISSRDVAPQRVIARCVEASRLTLGTGVAATAGSADVYAIIAVPA